MRHLFIINPAAYKMKGQEEAYVRDIIRFFRFHEHLTYDIHITRWERDALGYIQRYTAGMNEPLRVHSMGGSSTLNEVVNGVIGLPGMEIAAYPLGRNNCLLRYFGMDNINLFKSLENQVLSDTIPIDALRCGNRYGIAFGSIGLEAYADRDGSEMMERGTLLPEDFVYVWAGLKSVLKNKKLGQAYTVDLDGQSLDGEYSAILIANGPCYGKNMNPAIDAHPNDGILDIYLTKDMSRLKYITTAPKYVSGNYRKMPGIVRHYRGTKISVASESDMCVCIDGGTYYESTIEYEVVPRAIRLACPKEIDTQKLPRLYNRPEGGYVGEQQKE